MSRRGVILVDYAHSSDKMSRLPIKIVKSTNDDQNKSTEKSMSPKRSQFNLYTCQSSLNFSLIFLIQT